MHFEQHPLSAAETSPASGARPSRPAGKSRRLFLAALALVVLLATARYFPPAGRSQDDSAYPGSVHLPVEAALPARIPWEQVDAEVSEALHAAAAEARRTAETELDRWVAGLQQRIDDNFLDWYFSYWQQQLRDLDSLKYILQAAWDRFRGEPATTVADRLAADIADEFAARVLHPEAAQLRIEQIMRRALQTYLNSLDSRLADIAATYRIPRPGWDRYLQSIAWTVTDVPSGRQVPVSVKAMVSLPPVAIGTAAAQRAGIRLLARSGSKTGAQLAARAVPVLIGAVIAWEICDYYLTRAEGIPLLREALAEYLAEMRADILDGNDGIMTAVDQVNAAAVSAVAARANAAGSL